MWWTLENVHIITGQMHPCVVTVDKQGVECIRSVLAVEANMAAVGLASLEAEVHG